jgi:hypothetical protein
MTVKYLREMPGIDSPIGYRYVLVKCEGVGYGAEPFTYRGITLRNDIKFVEGHDITEWLHHLPQHSFDHHLMYIDDMDILGKFL